MSVNANVIIYTTEYCGFCVQAKRLLSKKNVSYTEIDVGDRSDLRSWLVQASGQRTVPQIFINGQSVGGFTDIAALDRGGKLDAMLSTPPDPSSPPLPK
jgi:glutaredoxin 3